MTSTRMEQLQQMLESDPGDQFLQYALALEYGRINESGKAIAIIESILEKDPQYLGAYYQLGKYYEENGQREKALSAYKKGLDVATEQKNIKTAGELRSAMENLEE